MTLPAKDRMRSTESVLNPYRMRSVNGPGDDLAGEGHGETVEHRRPMVRVAVQASGYVLIGLFCYRNRPLLQS